jgi:hypothetical protein
MINSRRHDSVMRRNQIHSSVRATESLRLTEHLCSTEGFPIPKNCREELQYQFGSQVEGFKVTLPHCPAVCRALLICPDQFYHM